MLAEIEQAAKVLSSDQKERLVASLLAGLRKEGFSKVTGDEAARASLLPLAATAWSQGLSNSFSVKVKLGDVIG